MIVVSDTTPIHYLILIGKEHILSTLFTEVVIPDVVLKEMSHPNAPEPVRRWTDGPPEWAADKTSRADLLAKIKGIGAGESSAIALAIELEADAVLMDDRKATREAVRRGLNVLTTFALLELASEKGLLDFANAIDALSKTNFHFPPNEIVDGYLRRNSPN
jgi:predicted nucleic acid-binding protein